MALKMYLYFLAFSRYSNSKIATNCIFDKKIQHSDGSSASYLVSDRLYLKIIRKIIKSTIKWRKNASESVSFNVTEIFQFKFKMLIIALLTKNRIVPIFKQLQRLYLNRSDSFKAFKGSFERACKILPNGVKNASLTLHV